MKEAQLIIENLDPINHSQLANWSKKPLNQATPEWIIKIHHFLREWFSDSKTIRVQTSGTVSAANHFFSKKKHFIFSAKESLTVLQIPTGAKSLLCLPMDYIAAKMMLVRALVGNLNLHCIAPTSKVLEKVIEKFDFAALVPYQLFSGMKNIENINCLLIGGTALDNSLEKMLKKLPTKIFETFGMAETLTHIALRKISNPTEQFFRPLPSVKITKTADNCLKIKAPKRGLVNYFKTNDLVTINQDGSFSWLGRLDNLIQSGSLKICPEILEQKIKNKLAKIIKKDFFLSSVANKKLGSELIILLEGDYSQKELTAIKIKLKQNFKFYEIPRQFVIVEEFLRNKNLKLLRKATLKSLDLK